MIDGFYYNSYFQSAGQHQSQQQVQQQKFCRSNLATTISGSAPTAEFIDDIDLMLNKIILHQRHLTTSSFAGGATSGMGISKVQHQKWITNIEKNNNELHNIVYSKVRHQDMESTSSTTSSIKRYGTTSLVRRYGFNIVIYNIEMDKKNNHHLGKYDKGPHQQQEHNEEDQIGNHLREESDND